jgi:hypothetical protein
MAPNLQVLQAARVNAIMRGLTDTRELPAELVFLGRTPVVPATDGEIMARFTGRVQIADLVADDQKAAVYSAGKFTLETSGAPNLKHGQMLTQEQLKQLEAISAAGVEDETGFFNDTENAIIDSLLLGVRQRMEAICVARALDGFSYDRLGIKMQNVTWGMPSDLKLTLEVPITDHTNCKIVTYVSNLLRSARIRYGITYDRWTMSLAAFNEIIACDEFIAKARMYLAPNVSFVNLNTQNTADMTTLAQRVFGIAEIELYDSRYWSEDESGALTSAPYLPINKSIFSARANDNNRMVADWANGVPTEVVVSNLVQSAGGMIGSLPRNTRGPIAYATGDLNPPQVTYWGVGRGWSRKHLLQETAVMTLAPTHGADSIDETVPVGEPF